MSVTYCGQVQSLTYGYLPSHRASLPFGLLSDTKLYYLVQYKRSRNAIFISTAVNQLEAEYAPSVILEFKDFSKASQGLFSRTFVRQLHAF